MPIYFIDLFPNIRQRLVSDRQAEMQVRVKKPIRETHGKKSNDSLEVVDVKTDGGIKSYVKGAPVPIRSYPDGQTVLLTAIYKRFIPLIAGSLKEQGWVGRIITLWAIKNNWKVASDWFGYVFKLNPYLLKEEYWCQPIKEVRRVLKGKVDDNFIDALSLVLEYDGAYKYRFQDVIGELDKSKGISEVGRMFDLLAERDAPDMSNKFRSIKKLVGFALFLPKVRKLLKEIISDINIEEIKFSREDLYWVNMNASYQYRGLSIEDRRSENLKMFGINVL